MDLEKMVVRLCRAAKDAARKIATAPTGVKNRALREASERLRARTAEVLEANRKDVEQARKRGLPEALVDRLVLNEKRVEAAAAGLDEVARLPDPVGETIRQWIRPNGLEISQVRTPIGVVGIIYESRPNVTVDAAALCLKSGNAVILKGGSEAFSTNRVLAGILSESLAAAGLPDTTVQLLPTTDREAVRILLSQTEFIDVIIPRGGTSLIRAVTESSRIPVIQHYAGICHTYVDEYADLSMAEQICINAKVQRPGVCNAMETLLVHEAVAGRFLPMILEGLEKAGVEIRGCERTCRILSQAKEAAAEDWETEYLDLILSVKVVSSFDEAVDFINTHGSGHSDAVVTDSYDQARRFLREVDSSAVYVNASTRFTDGYEFGFGAEVGISTNRLHARGPMGLRELTTYKYTILGSGQIRE